MILLVMTDGRDYIYDTIASALENLRGEFTHKVIYDDSDDAQTRRDLFQAFPTFTVIGFGKRGFGGAIGAAWEYIGQRPEEYVFHLEDDFLFNRSVNLNDMAAVLDANPYLAQIALRRQPVNEIEIAAGGIVESRPDSYIERYDGLDYWLEHRNFFTTNPSLYRTDLTKEGWPQGPESEGQFGIELFSDPEARCAFWGARDSGEWVTHVGDRQGTGY